MEINQLVQKVRKKLIDYRYALKDEIVSKHINAIDIAVCLVEYSIKDKTPIELHDQKWFEATYQIDFVLGGGNWEELSNLYSQLVTEVKKLNYSCNSHLLPG